MKKLTHLPAAIATCLCLTPFGATAETTSISLRAIVDNGAAISTVALHCAGLFYSVWDFGSEVRLDAENIEHAKTNTARFLDAAITLRSNETGAAEETLKDAAVAEAFAVSSAYYKHYQANVEAGREPYATDRTWNDDLDVCRNLEAQL